VAAAEVAVVGIVAWVVWGGMEPPPPLLALVVRAGLVAEVAVAVYRTTLALTTQTMVMERHINLAAAVVEESDYLALALTALGVLLG
jgi:hypothetical protein